MSKVLILFLSALILPASGSTFDIRAAEVIKYFTNASHINGSPILTGTPKYAFFYAEAKFYDYETNLVTRRLAEARALANAGLDNLNADDPPFQLWRAMDCYLRWGHLFDDALKGKFKSKLVASIHYGYHNTQNKIWMAATARYLAEETWPGEAFGSGYGDSDPTGRTTLLARMESYVHEGETEHNSPTYFAMYYGSLRSLADLAQDPEIKKKAALTAEWLLASASAEWLDGLWCAATERIYNYNAFGKQSTYGAGSSILWLYFGGPTPTNWNAELVDAVQSVCSAYRPPAILVSMAQDRANSYTHRESHNSLVTHFFGTTYMTKDYSLYSQHEKFTAWGIAGGMDQVQRWSVAFRRSGGNCRFFVQHYMGTKVAEMGATEYEQVLQSGSALIGVWNKPLINIVGLRGQNSSNPIRGWIPENPAALINESTTAGRIYLHYGNIMIALYISKPFAWDGSSTGFSLSGTTKLGMVLELASPVSYAGGTVTAQLASFKAAFENNWNTRVNVSRIGDAAPMLTYTALDGTAMETVFRVSDKINGKAVVYDRESWNLQENSWAFQRYLNDTLKIAYGASARVYDFGNWRFKDILKSTKIQTPTLVQIQSESWINSAYDIRGRRIGSTKHLPSKRMAASVRVCRTTRGLKLVAAPER